jgi:hypothetical protein
VKRFWVGFGAGLFAGIVLVLGGWYLFTLRYSGIMAVDGMARRQIEAALPGSRVLDVQLTTFPESSTKVNYVHEHLYDVSVVYQYRGNVKQITIPYGMTRNGWVSSSASDLVIMDDTARVIRALKQSEDRK